MNKYPNKFTYWRKIGIDYTGVPEWDGPHVANCRWEDEQRLYITDSGREARGRSTLYTTKQLLDIGDYVYEGVSDKEVPPTNSYEVKQPRKIGNIRGTRVEHRYVV